MSRPLPLAEPVFGEEEVEAVAEVVRSRWLTMGPRTAAFEAAFAEMVGVRQAVMVSSCTAALHLAFQALGIGAGDEVIVPSLTFVASANAVAYTGAEVRFADIVSVERPLLDVDDVAARITDRTAAICAVHYAGYPADMEALGRLAARHGLALVEDAAHAPGAVGGGGMAGGLGDVGCFSFFSNKNLVTGEGGMLTTDDDELAAKLRLLRAHGMTATSWDRERGHATGYDVIERGYNYRPSELEAALGSVQLRKLPGMLERRRALVSAYREAFAAHADLGRVAFEAEDDALSACHILPLVCRDVETREALRRVAAESDIQTSVHYPPVHRFRIFEPRVELPVTESYADREVTLPLFPSMDMADVARVAAMPAALVA